MALPCTLCKGRTYVELPLAEPAAPRLPVHPARIRLFIYGAIIALAEADSGRRRRYDPRTSKGQRRDPRTESP